MSDRQRTIVRAILAVLYDLDGNPATDTILHAGVNLKVAPPAPLGDFDLARRFCEQKRWIVGTTGQLENVHWTITDKGRGAHAEMQ